MVPWRADWPKNVALGIGVMVSAFGAAVLMAWYVHFIPLIQLGPGQPPLTRQGALAELLLGAALAFVAAGRRRPSAIFAGIVFVLAMLVGFEYVLDRDLGIDQLLGSGYITEGASPRGRISPVAAFSYAACALGLLAMSIRRLGRYAEAIAGVVASVLIAVGSVLFMVYLVGHMPAYGWGHFRHISIQASAVLVFLGAGILILALQESRMRKTLPRWLPVALGLALVAGALGVWQALIVHEESQLPLLSHIILAGGIVSASLVAIAVHLAQKATLRNRQLQEGKAEFERLFDASLDALLVTDRNGRIVGANPRVQGIFGYTRDEILGAPIDSLVPITRRDLHRVHRESYYASPRTRPMGKGLEFHGRRKDGSEFPVDVSLSPLRLGDELRVLAAARDITERKQAEEAVRQSEERFRGVFETSPLGLALIQPDYRLAKVNASLCRMSGYSEAELVGMNPFDFTHPDDLEKSQALAAQLFKGEIPFYQIEKRYVKKSGEIIWVNMTATILRDRQGRPLVGLGMVEDVTERKQAQEALRQSEERFRGLIEQGPIGITLMDRDYRLIKVNAAICRMLGYSEAELTTMTPLDFTHPDDREPTVSLVERLFGLEIPMRKMEKRYVKKSGEVIWGSVTASVIHDPQGKPLYAMGMIEDITERKRAERKLTEQAALIYLAHDAIIGRDLADRITFWNRGAQDTYGWSAEEALGRVTHELLQTRFPIPLREIKAVILARGGWEGELEHTTRNGKTIVAASRWSAQLDEQGAPRAFLEINRDITLGKRAEEELRTLSQRLSQAVRFASMSVWEWDPRMNCFTWDDTAFEMAGIPKVVPLPYEQWASLVHPDDRPQAEAALQRVVWKKTQESAEFRVIRPDGGLRHAYAAGGPILDGQGNVARVVGIAIDITERKRAEEELHTLSERLSLATRIASIGVWDIDLRTNLAVWDDASFEMFGLPKVNPVPYEKFVEHIHPDDVGKVEAMTERIVRRRVQDALEYRIVRSDGSLRHLSVAAGAVLDEEGNVSRIVGIVIDITERKQLEQDLEAAREQAITSARLSALGMMAGGIAHEINNPLSIIHAMASDLKEMVEEQGSAPPRVVARKSAVIRETAERIAKIVKSLRQISREGSSDLFHPTPVAKILAETLEICRAKFQANSVDLLLPRAIPELSVPCREVQIAQALLNLLQNAFDAVTEQDGKRWVRLEVEPRDESVAISVIDSGPGIPSELRSRIGEPFFTTKPVGKGTGLGLSLSKTIAEDHGGALEYSEDSGHTRFSLVLPLARKAEAA